MDNIGIIGSMSIFTAGMSIALGGWLPALAEGNAVAAALKSMAQQPEEAGNITRTLFISMAMIESSVIYSFVVSMILLFANPFWDHVIK